MKLLTNKSPKFCPGCGHLITLRMLGQAIEELGLTERTFFLVDIGCSLLAWDFFNLPTSQTHHGRTIPTAVGLKMAAPSKIVIAYMGDGGGYAIGLQHTISSCLRDDPITTIVVNNTLYAMTGGQSAPTTLANQTTTTSDKKNILPFLGPETLRSSAHPQAFISRGTTIQPSTLKEYFKKALQTQLKNHWSLVESLSACPTNWRTNPTETIAKMQVLTKTFKTGEVKK